MKYERDGLNNVFGRGLANFEKNPILERVMIFIYPFSEGVKIFTYRMT